VGNQGLGDLTGDRYDLLSSSEEVNSGTATRLSGPRPFYATSPNLGGPSVASLNHIGIAVADLPAIKKLFSLLNLEVNSKELVSEQGVMTHFLPLPLVQGYLELLEPVDEQGTVAQFIKKRGPGIHHLSFTVNPGELEPICARLKANGYRLIYDQPKDGAHGMKINFIHPSTSGGILIELMEPR
jgi:methylmalonyl-CoA/ethylmalonyl-CoA epimerase